MTPERWREVTQIYGAVVSRPPEHRAAAVIELCGTDPELRHEIEALLESQHGASLLDRPASERGSVMQMVLPLGSQIGVFRIDSLLGVGGMGEVYRARDTKLNRDVAIKILPPAFANDPERLARFKREAQVLASLNHPNVGGIYGFEDSGGVHALVLELVEGLTLADLLTNVASGFSRTSRNPSEGGSHNPTKVGSHNPTKGGSHSGGLSVEESLGIARQIAEALEAAHEQGIIHRDLKPANVKVPDDGTVKVLDFGLAKLADPVGAALQGGPSLTQSPTITTPAMTQAGMILGTAAYMSPEQAKGRPADKRSDIWAFGCVLYEMLTGKRAFDGEDVSETLASVLRSEPDWSALPQTASPTLQLVLRRCLEKDRRSRIPDIAAVKFLIDQRLPDRVSNESPAPAPGARRKMVMAVGGFVIAALAAIAAWRFKPSPDPPRLQPVSFAFSPSEGPISTPSPVRDLVISPDGHLIVYEAGASPTTTRLYARNLDDLESRPLTEPATTATGPFFSPDGQWVGFIEPAMRELRKVPTSGGPSTRICTYEGVFYSAAWLRDGRIVFGSGPNGGALFVVSALGGQPEPLTKQPLDLPQVRYRFPSILPDDHNILVSISVGAPAGSTGSNRVAVLNLDTRGEKTVIEDATQAEYVDGGFLVYVSQGALRAKRFDPDTLTAQGDSAVVVDRLVTKAATGVFDFSVSRNGNLIYVRGAGAVNVQRALTWVDRGGNETAIRAPLKPYAYARLSPQGDRIALDVRDENTDIWVWDIAGERLSPLTRTPELDTSPIWTLDGQRIIFGSTRGGGPARLFWQRADGSGPAEPLATSNVNQVPSSLSPDGTFLVFTQQGQHGVDAMMLRLQADRHIEPLVQTEASAQNAVLSPDMKWVAYQSNEPGRDEIYVRPFPEVNTGRSLISNGGGTRPLWDPRGNELFYLDADGFLTSVSIHVTPQFKADKPTRLFQTHYYAGGLGMNARTYDISHDGKRFLMIKETGGAANPENASSVVVLANWIETLRAKLTPADQRRR